MWHLTLVVCCAVFTAILIACFIALRRAPRADHDTPADLSTTTSAEPRLRYSVITATAVSVVLLLGLIVGSPFTTMVHTGALGALLALAPGVWYPSYIESTSALGFDPLQDQQLGGFVMWVPGGLAYLIGGLVVRARWLTRRTPPPAVPPIPASGTTEACAAPPRRMADMRLARFKFCSRRVPGPWCLLCAWSTG